MFLVPAKPPVSALGNFKLTANTDMAAATAVRL
jgi:hypothetical protein